MRNICREFVVICYDCQTDGMYTESRHVHPSTTKSTPTMSPASSQPNRHLTAKHTMHIVRSSFRESDVMPHDAKLSDHGLSQHHICDILRVRSLISRLSQLLTFYLGFHLRPSLVCFRPISPLIRLTHVSATLVHAFLYFRKQIWTQARRSIHEQPDIHARLMSKYPQGRD